MSCQPPKNQGDWGPGQRPAKKVQELHSPLSMPESAAVPTAKNPTSTRTNTLTGKENKPPRHLPFAYASPWILAAAIALLTAIVIFFAINNFQQGKRIMAENLFHKGQAILRFVGAGSRASMMMGVPGTQQVQHLLEQATGESGILYIAVLGADGTIKAHSTPSLVGSRLAHPLPPGAAMPAGGNSRVISGQDKDRIFEVFGPFRPFRGGHGQAAGRHRRMTPPGQPAFNGTLSPETERHYPPLPEGSETWGQGNSLAIVVGLDMTEQEAVIRQDLSHMASMSIVMLLVAMGGWTALLTAQSYRSSQKTLRNMQAFTDLLISRLPVGIIATNAQNQIQTCNRAAAALLGTEQEQVVGEKADTLPGSFSSLFEPAGEKEEIVEQEMLWPPQSRYPAHLHVSSMPIADRNGEKIGRVALIHDLSEIKMLEEQVRRQDRFVALGKMAAGVAHEVRNPLSSIKGFATLLGSRFAERSEEREAADLLIEQVERLNRSITELLTYARPLPLRMEEVELGSFIDDSLKLIHSDARELGVSVSRAIDPEQRKISLDRDRMNQVLLNLYLNSLQAMDNGGELRVTARNGSQESSTEITVQDTGCGMTPEVLERAFDPYFTSKPQGTGLGLAMVYRIIDEHGGNVWISSRENQGTTVTLTLPSGPATRGRQG